MLVYSETLICHRLGDRSMFMNANYSLTLPALSHLLLITSESYTNVTSPIVVSFQGCPSTLPFSPCSVLPCIPLYLWHMTHVVSSASKINLVKPSESIIFRIKVTKKGDCGQNWLIYCMLQGGQLFLSQTAPWKQAEIFCLFHSPSKEARLGPLQLLPNTFRLWSIAHYGWSPFRFGGRL